MDGLSPVVLKECAAILSLILFQIFNECLLDDKIPDCWRLTTITPVTKKDSSESREIACTLLALEALEKLVLPYLTSFPNASDSYPRILVFIALLISLALDKKCKGVKICFLDYIVVFNCVDRHALF